ncbi:MAG: chloride channel protein [Hyphomicrobiales bacterium]
MPESFGRFLKYVGDQIAPNIGSMVASKRPLVWLLALLSGVLAAYAIIAFRFAIGFIHYPWLGTYLEGNVATAAAQTPWYILVLVPTLGGLFVGFLLHKFVPGRRAQSVADVIEARALGGANISLTSGWWSAAISALSLGVGASAGREGPAVHLGSAMASAVGRKFDLTPEKRRVILACGAAAAVSASFNAPIAGVLFAHEVILGHIAISAFAPTAIAAVAATLITRFHLGDFPAFTIPTYEITSLWEFPAFALLGVTCGVVALCFQFSVIIADYTARSIKMPLWLRPAIGGLLIGLMAIFIPEILGVGYEVTDRALHQLIPLGTLFLLLIAKAIATAITMASRFGGGVFSPSIYLGAMAGGAFGILAAKVFPDLASSDGLYAILGMGGVAGAILGAPISTVLIAFELTGGYQMTIALLITVSIASVMLQAVHGHSIFHWQLNQRGLFFDEGPHREVVRRWRVKDFMTPLSEDEILLPPDPDSDMPMLTPEDTLESALRAFDQSSEPRIPVVDTQDASLVIGWAEHMMALRTYNQALVEAHVEEHR